MLTQRQLQLLKYIDDYQHEHGVSPSFDEMKEALDLRSKSGIHRLITGAGGARLPAPPAPPGPGAGGAEPAAEAGRRTRSRPRRARKWSAAPSRRPLVDGAARRRRRPTTHATAALRPHRRRHADRGDARQRDHDRRCPSSCSARGEHFVLEVAGRFDDRGRHPRRRLRHHQARATPPTTGEIVVALVDERGSHPEAPAQEGRLDRPGAANPAYETRIFGPDQVEVQGQLVGLIRRY